MPPKLPPIAALRIFEVAARLKSFARAAEEIHVTPSAVSHQIKALEAFLGLPLFARNGRRQVTLTREGAAFSHTVSVALGAVCDAADALRQRHRNRLTVSVLPSFAARWLMPRIGRFVELHPEFDLSIRSTTTHADFVRDDVDIAIRFGPGTWPNLHSELFMHDELFPVCSSKLSRAQRPHHAKDLGSWPLFESDPDGWQQWFRAAGVAAGEGRKIDLGDASLALQAAIDGRGIALTRRSVAQGDLESGAVIRLFDVAVTSQYSYYLVWPAKADLSPNAKAFRDWLHQENARPHSAAVRGKVASRRGARKRPSP